MFGVQVKFIATPKPLAKATDKAAFKNLRHAAFSIRKAAIESMVFAKGPSKPGTPPHAHKGRVRRSILVAQDDSGEVVIGPSWSRVKAGGRPPWLAQMLEHGGTFPVKQKRKTRGRRKKGEAPQATRSITFPPRPFMQPALQRNLARFHRDWRGAI